MKILLKKIFTILPERSILDIGIIVLISIPIVVFEILSIGLIIPFLSIFINENNFLSIFFNNYGVTEKSHQLLFIIFSIGIVFLLKNASMLFLNKKKFDFIHDLAGNMSFRIYNNYLNKNYLFFSNTNSSKIIRDIINESNLFSFSVILTLANIFLDSLITISILIFLFSHDFIITISLIILISIFSFLLIFFQNKKLKYWGKIRVKNSGEISKLILETFGNIKEIIFFEKKSYFLEKFKFFNNGNITSGKKKDFYFSMPRPILEVILVFVIFFVFYISVHTKGDLNQIFITLGVITFASIKLIPMSTNLVKSFQGLKYYESNVSNLYEIFSDKNFNKNKINLKQKNSKLKSIVIKNVSFKYELNSQYILEKINLSINGGEKIGILGETGSGKSTFLNLISGLINPSKGEIIINGQNKKLIYEEFNIGYVSQSPFLADESIKFNIIFSKLGSKVDEDKVSFLIDKLKLNSLIKDRSGINTTVGEKGIKISGGQIQRIAIARAIYANPEVLFLDEATSQLDKATQNDIMDEILYIMKDKTVIIISHDEDALKNCDKIYKVMNNSIAQLK